MDVVAFKAEHLRQIDLQESQQYLTPYMTDEQAKAIEESGWAWTAIDEHGPIGCAGIIHMWQGRGLVWAYIASRATGSKFLAVHKAVQRFLDACYIKRLEMTVDPGFEQGHRWAELLGFEMEAAYMAAYRPDGGSCSLYARVL